MRAVDPGVELGSLICFDDLHFLSDRLPDGDGRPGVSGRGHWIYEDPYSPGLRGAAPAGGDCPADRRGVARPPGIIYRFG